MFPCCTCCAASCSQVPLLKGLSDNDLLRVAGRMPERVYEDGEALIKYGERGDEMYLIRYGKVGIGSCSCSLYWYDVSSWPCGVTDLQYSFFWQCSRNSSCHLFNHCDRLPVAVPCLQLV